MKFKRVLIEKKQEFNTEAKMLLNDFKDYLKLDGLTNVRVINVYDLVNVSEGQGDLIKDEILFEKPIDLASDELLLNEGEKAFRVKFLEGQFNQREDSTNQLIGFLIEDEEVYASHTKIIVLENIDEEELEKVKKYYINPVEMKEISLGELVERKIVLREDKVEVIENFRNLSEEELEVFKADYGIGMDLEDIEFCQKYFREDEKRDPTIVEMKLIDTYWSDHCRHTTFETEITNIDIEEGKYEQVFQSALDDYISSRNFVFGETDRPITLMDLGTINGREVGKKGLLDDKEKTDEVNAASIEIDVDVDGRTEKWLLMFKNETHNHPTEIEPFGGAATCLGGAIRDPLSGRSYVYQAMRITGSADPRAGFEDTLEGKLPQRTITRTARDGYSSYGYEIGAATGYVREIYDQGYMAKRMEVGALVAAAPKENVYRGQAEPGDLIVLVGGRTGRDGLGGAVGSSQKHTEDSLEDSGAEVQKGNPKVERKILRMFRRKEVSTMIKVCNDFGAGGVSVAIGELADGVNINLDKVPLKYPGLDGTEIALSESQERMAALIDREDLDEFLRYADEEDVEATLVAEVTEERVLKMTWRGDTIVEIDRGFLETNGIRKKNDVRLTQPQGEAFFEQVPENVDGKSIKEDFINNMRDLNIGSQKGLVEGFDQTVGRGAVLSPMGGKYRMTPAEGMASKIPVLQGDTRTCSLMTYGFDPKISKWSCFHGGYFAVIESIGRIVALGGDYRKIRFSFQEYFERLGTDPEKWGKTFAALLGAYEVQKNLDLAAIGGKDSMSGSFEDLHVPPTIISFAVATEDVRNIISPEFKNIGSEVGLVELKLNEDYLLDFEELKSSYGRIKDLIDEGKIISASTVKYGGLARSIGEMSLGNGIGFEFEDDKDIFKSLYGSIVVELDQGQVGEEVFEGLSYRRLGRTTDREEIIIGGEKIGLKEVLTSYEETLEEIFPVTRPEETKEIKYAYDGVLRIGGENKLDRPKVLIPVITGTHGEYDMARSFRQAGGQVSELVIKTSSREELEESLKEFIDKIKESQIIAFPDGQILGGEPESDGKLYRLIFKKEEVKQALEEHIYGDNGLILGIGAGCEALIKSGLLEYGEVRDVREDSVYLASNKNSNFLSEMVDIQVTSNLSPWFREMDNGDIYTVPLASKNARIVGENMERLIRGGQVASVFRNNLTGSAYGAESITSPDGRILGTLASIDRIEDGLYKNIDIKGRHRIFESGINYFK